MPKPLSAAERLSLAAKASKLHSVPVGLFDDFSDDGLRVLAGDLSKEEMAERERNSDWVEEMEGANRDAADFPKWISLAEQIARNAHAGQFRKDGITPYITHPAEIVAVVTAELKPIAWLHDVVEDTSVTLADLGAAGLPTYVLAAVHALTKVEGEDYAVYLERVCANDHARQVKIADIENNLQGQPSEKARAKYQSALPILRGTAGAGPPPRTQPTTKMTNLDALMEFLAKHAAAEIETLIKEPARLNSLLTDFLPDNSETEDLSPDSEESQEAATLASDYMESAGRTWRKLTPAARTSLLATFKARTGPASVSMLQELLATTEPI